MNVVFTLGEPMYRASTPKLREFQQGLPNNLTCRMTRFMTMLLEMWLLAVDVLCKG